MGELLTERICAGLVGGILGTPFAFYFGKKRKGVAMKRLIMPLMIALLFVASVSAQEFKVPVEVVQRVVGRTGYAAGEIVVVILQRSPAAPWELEAAGVEVSPGGHAGV